MILFCNIQVSGTAEDEEFPVDNGSPTFRRKSLGLSRPKHRVCMYVLTLNRFTPAIFTVSVIECNILTVGLLYFLTGNSIK